MLTRLDNFQVYRGDTNERIIDLAPIGLMRFNSIETTTYYNGILDATTKELTRSTFIPLLEQTGKTINLLRFEDEI